MELWQSSYEAALSIPAAARHRLFSKKEEVEAERRRRQEEALANSRRR